MARGSLNYQSLESHACAYHIIRANDVLKPKHWPKCDLLLAINGNYKSNISAPYHILDGGIAITVKLNKFEILIRWFCSLKLWFSLIAIPCWCELLDTLYVTSEFIICIANLKFKSEYTLPVKEWENQDFTHSLKLLKYIFWEMEFPCISKKHCFTHIGQKMIIISKLYF